MVVFAHDVLAAGIAWIAAFWLRFNFDVPADYQELMLESLPWVLGIHAAVFWVLRLYRGLWRYASLPDLQRIAIAIGIAALAVPAAFALVRLGIFIPRTVYVLTPVLLGLAMGGNRLAYRAWREGRLLPILTKPQSTPVLVLGAGMAASGLLKDMATSGRWRVVGMLDDDAQKAWRSGRRREDLRRASSASARLPGALAFHRRSSPCRARRTSSASARSICAPRRTCR